MAESKPPPAPHVTNDEYWAPIPEALLYDPGITAEAVRVYGVLRRHGDDPANCYPGYPRIAEFIGAKPRSIPKWIRELEDAGWVQRVKRFSDTGDQLPNAYRVFSRAAQRGVRANERGGTRQNMSEGARQPARQNESHLTNPMNDLTADALLSANPNDLTAEQLKRLLEMSDEEAPLREFA